MTIVCKSFYSKNTLDVSKSLLGCVLCREFDSGDVLKGMIVETEAYTQEDPACHAFRGITKRAAMLFKSPGLAYVYLIYGMYYCLNFVTQEEGFPAAVLIRSVHMTDIDDKKLNGPGKLCRFLGITKEHNNIDLLTSKDFYVSDKGLSLPFKTTSRIGISAGQDRQWRFVAQFFQK